MYERFLNNWVRFLTTGIPFYMLKAWLPKDTRKYIKFKLKHERSTHILLKVPSSVTLFMTERLSAFAWSLVIGLSR